MNTDSSPGFALKSVCAASNVALAKGLLPSRRESRCRDGQERAADAIAHRVDFFGAARCRRRDRFHAVTDAQAQIVIHAEPAIGGRGILPGDHEHRVPAVRPDTLPSNCSPTGRARSNCSPRRNDQHGLREHRRSGRKYWINSTNSLRITTLPKSPVATDDELIRTARTLSLECALDILQPVARNLGPGFARLGSSRIQGVGC